MTRNEAKRVAKYLAEIGYYGISIIETYPEGEITVVSYNRAGMRRNYASLTEAQEDNR